MNQVTVIELENGQAIGYFEDSKEDSIQYMDNILHNHVVITGKPHTSVKQVLEGQQAIDYIVNRAKVKSLDDIILPKPKSTTDEWRSKIYRTPDGNRFDITWHNGNLESIVMLIDKFELNCYYEDITADPNYEMYVKGLGKSS